jgi:hypothetical protein
MSKREKIILVLLLVAVLYGVYEVFLSSPKKGALQDRGEELKALATQVTELSKELSKGELLDKDAYTIAVAEESWTKDPFYKKKIPIMRASSEAARSIAQGSQEVSFNYTGYMETDRKRLAIINGMEYQTGEELDQGGYIVQGIFSNRVIIVVKGKQRRIVVPIEEEIL